MGKQNGMRFGYGIPLVLACALATSCSLGKNAAIVAPGGTVNASQTTTERTARAQQLGLVAADSYVGRGEFQIKDAKTGGPLANAQITLGGQRLTTDERGVVVLPAELAFGSQETLLAEVTANGFVGQVIPLYPGAATKLSPIDTKRTPISAAGGSLMNSDGTVEVVFPPGALAAGGDVSVTRTYSETLQPNATLPEKIAFQDIDENGKTLDVDIHHLPLLGHYTYSLDMGNAQLAPGTKYSVRFKVEGPMKTILEARLAKGDDLSTLPDQVSKDASGNIWLTMQGFAPAAAPEGTPSYALKAVKANDVVDADGGGAGKAAPAIIAGPVADKPASAEAPAPVGPALGDWDAGFAYDPSLGSANPPAPNTAGDPCDLYDESVADVDANTRKYTNCYEDMDANWRANNWGARDRIATVMTHDSRFNGGGCVYFSYDPQLYVCRSDGNSNGPGWGWTTAHHSKIYRRWYTATIHAQAKWTSDDDRIKDRAVVGAKMSFSHAQAPMRQSALGQTTDANGNAETLGVKGTYGVVSTTVPGMPYVIADAVSYYVNCANTPQVRVVKNKPKVDLNTTVKGTATQDTLKYHTNMGRYTAPVARNTITLPIDLDKATEPFDVNGSWQPNSNVWVDTQSTSVNVGWNTSKVLNLGVWFSKQIGTVVTYKSNDNTVPADMRPVGAGNVWAGQPANADVTFSHAISTATNKPAGRDTLSFSNVQTAAAWGLNGAAGTVDGKRVMGAVTLTGSKAYEVSGNNVALELNANLPEIVLALTGAGQNLGWAMDYELTGTSGAPRKMRMQLPAPSSDGMVHVWLPVEEAVGSASTYTFKPTWIGNADYAIEAPGGGFNFPAVAGNHRGTVKPYASMGSTFTTPK